MKPPKSKKFVTSILSWHSSLRNSKDFPWRLSNNAYEILIAELMLRKTTRKQVIKIYDDFLNKFPTADRLAKSSVREIKEIIRPLGMEHKRARLFKRLAVVLMKNFDGKIPRTKKSLIELPGVGNYTANAVLCLVYGKDVPLVDTNVGRVMKRVFLIPYVTTSRKSIKNMYNAVGRMVPKGKAREFNLALLDFGALVCQAKKPKCNICPINDFCLCLSKTLEDSYGNQNRPLA